MRSLIDLHVDTPRPKVDDSFQPDKCGVKTCNLKAKIIRIVGRIFRRLVGILNSGKLKAVDTAAKAKTAGNYRIVAERVHVADIPNRTAVVYRAADTDPQADIV